MPEKIRIHKPFLGNKATTGEQADRCSPEQQRLPAAGQDRRIRSRRCQDASGEIENAMDVALGTEDEDWDRRRSSRRKAA